ncbi:24749_t:CDS:2, partial [Gigaspora margarita]
EFEQLYCLSDPVPGKDFYYKSFDELYGTVTSKEHRPSFKEARLQKSKVSKTKITTSHTMPAKKLSKNKQQTLKAFLDTIIYTCGISFNGDQAIFQSSESGSESSGESGGES